MSTPYLDVVGATKSFADVRALDRANLAIEQGESLALLGPSGCGKTTLLRAIAGLERLDGGRISVDGSVLTEGSRHVPAEKRRIGMVFQDWALFPHLSVRRNVAFGLSRQEVASGRVEEALDMVRMGHLAERKPHELSGGQAQRVALARALAPRPRLLLFDEPFASLDTELRGAVRAEVANLLRSIGVTSVFVTHDQEEAFVLGDRVAVMRDGQIHQVGSPAEIYQSPVNRWVAGFVGEANFLPGELAAGVARTSLGPAPVVSQAPQQDRAVTVLMRPEHVTIDEGSAAVVESVEFYGHDTSYRVRAGSRSLLVRVLAAPRHRVGDRVDLAYDGPTTVAYGHNADDSHAGTVRSAGHLAMTPAG
jgi:iron(III) transport system ATP-binding protein